jgi:hypothetical protein
VNPQVLQVLTWALGGLLTVALFALNRLLGKLDAAAAENKALVAANIDLKLSIIELKGTARAVDRSLTTALDILAPRPPEGSGT